MDASKDVLKQARAAALESIAIEVESVAAMAERIGREFDAAVDLILKRQGRLVVSGLGKSGHVGRKMAATFASTGTVSFFIHAGEALHGDAGMVHEDDTVILISNSGTTAEVCQFARMLRHRDVPIIALTGRVDSELGRVAEVTLDVSVKREADPLNLAPTASTVAVMAMGDALACALMAARGFRDEDFAKHHPGGALGAAARGED